jgi:hypothetical protein
MKKIILVAHGQGGAGTFSIPKVKTITPANEALAFAKAKEYINSSKTWPEYSSTSFGDYGPLSDNDCRDLFGGKIPAGEGIVSTSLHKGKDVGAPLIYALRNRNLNRDALEQYINTNNITTLILLACRS